MIEQMIPLKFYVHFREPVSGVTSFVSACLAIAGLVLMVIAAAHYGGAWHIVSFSVFGASLILLYFSSALYHLLPLQEKGVKILKRLDHMMIFVLIAGTYTPFCLVPLRGLLGWSLFGIIWALCVIGIFKKIFCYAESTTGREETLYAKFYLSCRLFYSFLYYILFFKSQTQDLQQ